MSWEDELTGILDDCVQDIVADRIENFKEAKLKEIKVGTDDGTAYGDYEIIIDGGKTIIALRASATYGGFEDCWSWATESHYTRDFILDELQDFEYEITSIKHFTDREFIQDCNRECWEGD